MTIDAIMPGVRVLCAVSGGVDSMYLLHRMTALGAQRGFAVGCAHFNHGLRGAESDRDEAFVRAQCEKLGVPFYAGRGDVASVRGMGTEAAARELRYAFLAQCAQAHSYDWIATAHTADDNAETLLLNLARGGGLRGLTGIPPQRGKLLRPMLDTTRAQAEAYLTAHAIPHVEDSTNAADAYARNRIRHYAVPALQTINPAAERAVGRLCNQLQELNIWLENLAEKLLAQAACGGGYSIPILAAADAPVLAAALRMLAARARDPEEKYVQALAAIVRQGSGAVQLTPDACWTAANGILYCRSVLKMQPETIPAPHQLLKTGVYCLPGGYELEIQQLNYEVFLKNPSFLKKDYTYCADYAKINKNIFVRTRQPGDTFRPAGRHVGKTLKKYLNEAKVPVAERTLMPLLACGSQVLWLWGAGFADGLSPDDGTKQILLIRQSRQPAAPEQEQDHNIGGTDHA